MPQLPPMTLPNLRRQLREQRLPPFRDPHPNDPTVIHRPFPIHQPPLRQPIHQPRNIRRPGNQPRPQLQRSHPLRMRRLQKPKRVVLLGRQLMARKQLILQPAQPVISPPEVEISLLLNGIKPPRLPALNLWRSRRHSIHIQYMFKQASSRQFSKLTPRLRHPSTPSSEHPYAVKNRWSRSIFLLTSVGIFSILPSARIQLDEGRSAKI